MASVGSLQSHTLFRAANFLPYNSMSIGHWSHSPLLLTSFLQMFRLCEEPLWQALIELTANNKTFNYFVYKYEKINAILSALQK